MKAIPPETLTTIKNLLVQPDPDTSTISNRLDDLAREQGIQAAYNALMRTEVALELRKPSLAIFDHTGHIIGGGQKYGFTIAHALQDMFDVTLLLNRDVTLKNIKDWYHLDLSHCNIKIVNIPFFDQFETQHLDPGRVSRRMENPFHIISKESGNYDFFINNSMNEKVFPLANVSALICHFPERRPKDYFYAHHYTYIVYNSDYTAHWIQQKWKLTPHKHIYPPVDMVPFPEEAAVKKENIILSVARFEEGGSKKQLEMVRTFGKLNRRFPDLMKNWTLVLAGGSTDDNKYLETIKETIQKRDVTNIRLRVNITGDELKDLYSRASIFWHICGLDQTDPALVEHFGMTIVEAMQNRIVPIVFDGGGQREIVEQEVSGYRAVSTAQLMTFTLKLVNNPGLRETLAAKAQEHSKNYTREVFESTVKEFFAGQLQKYRTI